MTLTACTSCGSVTDDGEANDLPSLPEGQYRPGGDPLLVRDELRHLIAAHISQHPRSQQTRVGPSELGTPCRRRLGYKLLNHPEVNHTPVPWKPTVGTAVHAWLEHALQAHNDAHTTDRFYLEERVTVGQVNGTDIDGSCDVYDRVTGTVIDWKVVGLAGLKRYRIDGPGETYQRQVHLYGQGFINAGLPVEHVAICFLPQNGELSDLHYWHEPFNPALAADTLTRANGVASLTASLGPTALELLPTADAYCSYCPWLKPGSTDLTQGCPGDDSKPATPAPATLADALN